MISTESHFKNCIITRKENNYIELFDRLYNNNAQYSA